MPSKSKQQQKFMGIVRSIQKGEQPAGKFSQDAQKAAKKMKKGSVKKYAKTKHDDLPTKKESTASYKKTLQKIARDKQLKMISKKDKDMLMKIAKMMEEDRDYKDEYKKFQSSAKSKKYRAELNKYNRKKGTYGNGDGKDASHKGGKIVGFESQSKNRGRAEKSRLKKEVSVTESDLGLTYKKGKTVKVKHKTSGKQLVIVDRPNVRKEYEKIGFFAEGDINELLRKIVKEELQSIIKEDYRISPRHSFKVQDSGNGIILYGKNGKIMMDRGELKNFLQGLKKNRLPEFKGINVEGTTQKFKSVVIDKAVKIAKSMGGNMTAAVKKIEKIEKNLSKNGRVEYALQQANESVNEAIEPSGIMAKISKIVQDKQAMKIGGVLMDMFSAGIMMRIYNAVNDKSKEQMNKGTMRQVQVILHKVMKQNKVTK